MEALNEYDICLCTRVALRKYCTSPPTTAAYNIILIMLKSEGGFRSGWEVFCKVLAEELNQGFSRVVAVDSALFKFEVRWLDQFPDRKAPPIPHALVKALKAVLQSLSSSDWQVALSLLD